MPVRGAVRSIRVTRIHALIAAEPALLGCREKVWSNGISENTVILSARFFASADPVTAMQVFQLNAGRCW